MPSDSFAPFAGHPISSAALVDRFRHSDPHAFAELFARHRDMVYRVCLRFLGHHHDAEDAVQETFRRAAGAIDRWDPQRPIEPWLVTIAGNRCRTQLKRRRGELLVPSLDELPADVARVDSTRLPSDEPSFITYEWVGRALSELPDDQRQAFQLIHQEGLSYPQAARQMDRSTGTIKTWVRRARIVIRDSFRRDDADAAPPSDATVSSRRGRRLVQTVAASLASLALVVLGASNFGGPRFGSITMKPQESVPLEAPPALKPFQATTENPARPVVCPHADDSSQAKRVSGKTQHVAETEAVNAWRLVSLEVFSGASMDFADFESMPAGTIPIEHWIERSSPIFGEFQEGIAPVGRTLRNVLRLFSCHQKTETPPASLIEDHLIETNSRGPARTALNELASYS